MSVKYRISYRRLSNNVTTIDILDSSYGGGIINLTPDGDPLNIAINGDVGNIYTPTVGSGATIKALSLPQSLTNLFTLDPQKYMVKIYNGASGTNLVWQGFVNTGLYSENYSTGYNVQNSITIECNDGMALLDEYYYKPIDSSFYTGFETIGTILNNVLGKLNITFNNIHTSNDLATTSAGTNFFTLLKVNNENYVDENLTAMSCREVLDSIFGALGLTMRFQGSDIYIVDPINLHNTAKGKVYDTATFTENASTLGGYLDISNKDIKWFETGSNMGIVQSFNQIKVNYDPYSYTNDSYGFTKENATYDASTYGTYTDNDVTYNIFTDVVMKDWTLGSPATFEGIQTVDSSVKLDDPEFYIKQIPAASGSFSYTFPLSNIKQDDNLQLELNMDVYVNTKHVSNIISPDEGETIIQILNIRGIEIKIGDKWWNGTSWQDTATDSSIYIREIDAKTEDVYKHRTWFRPRRYVRTDDLSRIDDQWTTVMFYMPISDAVVSGSGLLNGSISIKISAATSYGQCIPYWNQDGGPHATTDNIHNVLIKNISMQIVDTGKISILNEGVLRTADINSIATMKKKPTDIKLTNGTGPYGVSRGAFSGLNETVSGTNITGLYRAGDATIHNTIDLLSQSLLAEYNVPRSKLTGTLNVKDILLGVTTKLIQDSDYAKDENGNPKSFYIASGNYNDRFENMNVQMIECASTRDSIT